MSTETADGDLDIRILLLVLWDNPSAASLRVHQRALPQSSIRREVDERMEDRDRQTNFGNNGPLT
jgi:hypothetical protein